MSSRAISATATAASRGGPVNRQRGAAALMFILVMSIVAAMIGLVAIRGASSDLRLAGALGSNRRGLYCAEAGMGPGRNFFYLNYNNWNTFFDPSKASQSAALGYPFYGSLDPLTPTRHDYRVTIRDDYDEAPATDNPKVDSNLTMIMTSECLNSSYFGTRQIQEVVVFNVNSTYIDQQGHAHHLGQAQQ